MVRRLLLASIDALARATDPAVLVGFQVHDGGFAFRHLVELYLRE